MGTARRERPARLSIKLRQIRASLNLTQEQMAERLGAVKSPPRPGHISEFEQGKREPSLPVLLRYARLTGLRVDALIDDEIDLPDHLPVAAEAEDIRTERKSKAGRKRAR